MRRKNGFTLVELLAVIVVLAIIMIIAIPAVLEILSNTRKKTFAMSVNKYVTAAQSQYLSDANLGSIQGAGLYVYNIASDLGLSGVGANQGYIVVDARNADSIEYYAFLRDNYYMLVQYPIMANKMPDKDNLQIVPFASGDWSRLAANEKVACDQIGGQGSVCRNRNGWEIR